MWHPDMPVEYRNAILTGDARELARALPDASVDLIFTDPVYSERPLYDWLAQEARRILRPGGAVLCWSNGKWHRTNANWLEAGGLTYRYDFGVARLDDSPLSGRIISACNRVIWLDVDGKSKMRGYLTDGYGALSPNAMPKVYRFVVAPNSREAWVKSVDFTGQSITAFSLQNAVVFDPFTGGGTVPAVCKMLNRNYIAMEIAPATAARARERVEQTQAMEPILLGIQEPMELAV